MELHNLDFEKAARQIAARMGRRDPLGYVSPAFKEINPRRLLCSSREDNGDLSIWVYLKRNEEWVGHLNCDLVNDPVPAVKNLNFYKKKEWDGRGVSFEIMRRFLEAIDHFGFSYASTTELENGTAFFKGLDFKIIDLRVDINAEIKRCGTQNGGADALKQIVETPRSELAVKAVIDFTNAPHRNGVFRHLGLPLKDAGHP